MRLQRDALKAIKRLERAAYPEAFRALQDARTWEDLEEYAEGTVHHLLWDGGYCLWTDSEVVDLAATKPLPLARLGEIMRTLRNCFGDRAVNMDCRASTSYRLLRYYERKGVLKILSDHSYEWDGEVFHDITMRFRTSACAFVP